MSNAFVCFLTFPSFSNPAGKLNDGDAADFAGITNCATWDESHHRCGVVELAL
jgi:hypothetical protein